MAVNRYYSSNAVDTTLVNGVDASATEIVLQSTAGMPQSFPFTLALDYDTASEELVNVVGVGTVSNSYKVGSVVGTASVTGRGVDGNAATSHAAGAPVKHVISARDIREAQVHIDASTKYTVTNGATTYDVNLHGIAAGEGSVVGTAKTQTLTNKTISGTTNTLSDIPNTSVVGTAVTLAGTQTLTNKTLNLPKINEDVQITATSTEINILDGVTATAAELNVLDGITATTTELNYVDGVTSPIQNQFNNNTPVGTIVMYGGTAAPSGWLLCNGQSTAGYTALAAVVGSNVPDLRGRAPIGYGAGDGLTNRSIIGEKISNSETVTLGYGEIPSVASASHKHTHISPIGLNSGQITVISPNQDFLDVGGSTYDVNASGSPLNINIGTPGAPGTERWQVTSSSPSATVGSGGAHQNMQPSTVVNFIIKH